MEEVEKVYVDSRIVSDIPERGRRLPEGEWRRRKQSLLTYLREHPYTVTSDLTRQMTNTLRELFDGRINDAREAAGLKPKKELQKERLLEYLRKNPKVLKKDLPGPLKNTVRMQYHGRITDARKAAGLKSPGEIVREELLEYLREHPLASKLDLPVKHYRALYRVFKGRIGKARKAAGLGPKGEIQRERLLNYLRDHPEATPSELKENGYRSTLIYRFGGRINDARREAGVPVPDRGSYHK